MTSTAAVYDLADLSPSLAVAVEARRGLTSTPRSLPPWLFYDEAGSQLFEQITTLPEYYLTRTERALFTAHAHDIFQELGTVIPSEAEQALKSKDRRLSFERRLFTVVELGAGTASKTGILLRELARRQLQLLYQPIDISPTALHQARTQLESAVPGLTVLPCTANYISGPVPIERPVNARILALYIGSSIGNFAPAEAHGILARLRAQLRPGDALLLGVDLAPCLAGLNPSKSPATLLAAYNDSAGVTAAFNRNILVRLNRELGANFRSELFAHRALWNHSRSRIEIHLQPLVSHSVRIPANAAGPALTLRFAPGDTIHTENSYKFTPASIASMLEAARFSITRTFTDPANLFAVTLAAAV